MPSIVKLVSCRKEVSLGINFKIMGINCPLPTAQSQTLFSRFISEKVGSKEEILFKHSSVRKLVAKKKF